MHAAAGRRIREREKVVEGVGLQVAEKESKVVFFFSFRTENICIDCLQTDGYRWASD